MFKMLNRRKKKGQSTLEYAILIIIIIAALISIQSYIKRGIQGRLKSAADDVGDQFSVGNTNWNQKVVSKSHTNEVSTQKRTLSELLSDEYTNTEINSEIINADFEFWRK